MATFTWVIHAEDHLSTPPFGTSTDTIGISTTLRLKAGTKINAIRVREFHCPYITYNIISRFADDGTAYNNRSMTLKIPAGGVAYTITLPVGYYTGSQLLAAINSAFLTALAATAYTLTFTFNSTNFLITSTLLDGGVPYVGTYSLEAPSVYQGSAPNLIEILGSLVTVPIVVVGSTFTFPNPYNPVTDRALFLTCLNAYGLNTPFDKLNKEVWQDGIIAVIPLPEIKPGEVLSFTPRDDAQWIQITDTRLPAPGSFSHVNDIIGIQLRRDRYAHFGPNIVYYDLVLELR